LIYGFRFRVVLYQIVIVFKPGPAQGLAGVQ
jgi:hypothetical protein